jgi:hypothetical protein
MYHRFPQLLIPTPAAGGYNARAQYFFDQLLALESVSLGTTLEEKIDAFLDELISIGEIHATDTTGASDRLDVIYLWHLGSAAATKFNVLRPLDTDAAFRLSYSGGWTYDANGAKANGTNGYADTHYDWRDFGVSPYLGAHGTYVRALSTVNGGHGIFYNPDGANFEVALQVAYNQRLGLGRFTDYVPQYSAALNKRFFFITRRGNTDLEKYVEGASIYTGTEIVNDDGPDGEFLFGAIRVTGIGAAIQDYCDEEISVSVFSHVGYTDTQADNLNTAIENYAAAVGFNV